MANEQLTIQPNDARMTVIGKSWPDQASDSGGGEWDDTYNGTYSGPIPRTDLPDEIEIVTTSSKTDYLEGEFIRLSGIKVVAKHNGAVWTSAEYPDGVIPVGELGVSQPIATTKGSVERIADVDGHTFPVFYGDRLKQYVTLMRDVQWHMANGVHGTDYRYEAIVKCVKSKDGAPFVAMSWGTTGKTALEYVQEGWSMGGYSGVYVDSDNRYGYSVSENDYIKSKTGFFSTSKEIPMFDYRVSYRVYRNRGSRADAMAGLIHEEDRYTPTEYKNYFFGPFPQPDGEVYHSDESGSGSYTPSWMSVYHDSGSFPTQSYALPVGTVPDSFLSHITGTWDYWSILQSDMQRIVLSAVYDGVSFVKKTVNWKRPYDSEQLSASFNITVSGS